ncbi:MAG: flavodoxin-dependent (E)-4-hydroxy-3-methylbut-2-enyl-diphosphate synthase [Firmicutes bacterium]|nr:flavodoxin-dependent (E)-4-hydroxy-3-methylbut-2-enyl-diphosphate synthase [Bacillota bacterium]
MERKKTRAIKVGKLEIGGLSPITVQSMTNTDTRDAEATLDQVRQLEAAGCDIVRLAVFDNDCMKTIRTIKESIQIPIVADIHFDYRLAVASIEYGIDKLRINPGNIGSVAGIENLVAAAKDRSVPIRIGVNAGSLKESLLSKYGNTPKAMAESALEHVKILEDYGFYDIVISLKASNVNKTIEAYRYISQLVDYPLHLGVTEAGTTFSGIIKSSIGIGSLLADGIGDTIRVSLTASPLEEVKAGIEILKSLGLKKAGIEIISCPTCGRCNIDLIGIANRLQEALSDVKYPIKLAVMGCVVNGPGEAKEADIGIAGGKGQVALFKKGKVVGSFPEESAFEVIMNEIQEMVENGNFGNNPSL